MPEPSTGVIAIGWAQLALASGFIVLTGVLTYAIGARLEKDLAIATLRTYAQLLVLGFVLRIVFANDRPWWVLLLLALMMVVATSIILRRAPDAPRGLFPATLASMALTALVVTFAVTGLVVGVQPWYRAQYVIPIAGMVLGNSMTGIALTLERVFSDLDARRDAVLALTALGATPWEASRDSIRTAVRAGLIPTINSMAAVGIVFIPGMMTGQLLAGVDPLLAAPYQIVVMLMVSAATAMGAVMAVMLSYHRRFDEAGVFLERGHRE